jgi:hypothetical protein
MIISSGPDSRTQHGFRAPNNDHATGTIHPRDIG